MDFMGIIELDKWFQAFLILKVLDFLTGFVKAYKTTGFKSSKLRNGLFNVIVEISIIILAGILDLLLGLEILMISTKMLLIYKEAISIIENAGICGVPIPNMVKTKIQDLNPDINKDGGEKNE